MAKGKVGMHRQRLIEQRDQLLRDIEALRNKVIGIEMAISLIDGTDAEPVAKRGQRGGIKGILLDLLREAGTSGLNAATAVEIAQRRGTQLDRGTVSSLLSRLKADGVVRYDGERYRLSEFAHDDDRRGVVISAEDRIKRASHA